MIGMETYNGHVRTPADAIILFEACRIGLLPRVQRRLSEKERQSIKSGSVFVWDEREAGMRRWTDGKSWSASRVSGSFLTYREMEGKRGGNSSNAARDSTNPPEADSDGGGPDGYRYKPDGLMKQSFSITTNSGQHLHLISYFSRSSTVAQNLMQPTNDPQLRHIRPEKGMYPDSTVHEQSNIPAVTRGPMNSPGYTHAPNQPPYQRPPPYYQSWAPPSPMHTPPPHYPYSPYFHHGQHPGHPMQGMHYPPPPNGYNGPQHGTAYDRPPSMGAPPGSQYGQYPPSGAYQHTYPPPPTNHQSGYSGYQPPPLQQSSPYPSATPQSHEQRPAPAPAPPSAVEPDLVARKESPRPDTSSAPQPSSPTSKPDAQATSGASQPPASGQTIPSISAMLNAGADGVPPPRASSRSPGGTARGALQDIPSHKLGFEASRDVQALRNLDKTTFKQY
ncbi:unnamed protein product [Zymoseptoria tritici ST99CH_1A5]|uniref:cAMP-independent regulatory protein pac2 n=2 Tax=Zymoseptoria tritici TaxID=1047171 RepID=A0A2H1GJF5_ZYMTR|nr:unnamed protein product [Zymoseptoria tritici ST99CH_1E4]SMR56035.1 unnamed protein product [Zymoseptoria tritici ST99CH_3D1]SMY25215.1 unnamed protein product [Zymoseptoria tritici ST99CH_1A5]